MKIFLEAFINFTINGGINYWLAKQQFASKSEMLVWSGEGAFLDLFITAIIIGFLVTYITIRLKQKIPKKPLALATLWLRYPSVYSFFVGLGLAFGFGALFLATFLAYPMDSISIPHYVMLKGFFAGVVASCSGFLGSYYAKKT